jgi:hypothetical protein
MLWAVTPYFNPLGYRRRLAAYREFRRRLAVPLLAVELGFDGRFELADADADLLVRVGGGDLMWQKERLLNVAFARLPADCSAVACLDCDVFFDGDDWREEALSRIGQFPVLQAFSKVHHLSEAWRPGDDPAATVALSQPGVAGLDDRAERLTEVLTRREGTVSPGFAWIYQRDLLARHGLYDGCIIGGGDTAMVSAALGRPDIAVRLHAMNGWQERRYGAWAGAFFDSVRGRVGALSGDIFHIWHGALTNRYARERHLDLARFDFDPENDIAPGAEGAWRWSSDKPQLHAYLRSYFAARREDG